MRRMAKETKSKRLKDSLKKNQQQTTPQVKLSYPLLYLQVFLTLVMIVLGIITLFNYKMLCWFQLFLGLTLLDIALNNALFYKRNGGTIFYVLIGIVLICLAYLEMAGF